MKIKTENRYSLKKNEFAFVVLLTLLFFILLSVAIGLIYFRSAADIAGAYTFLALVLLIMASLAVFIYFTEPEVLRVKRKFTALLSTMLVSFLLIASLSRLFNIYVAPLCICALAVTLLVENKVSFFANFAVILIYYMSESLFGKATSAELYYLLLMGVITSIISSYSISKYSRRSYFLLIACYTGLASIFTAGTLYFMVMRDMDYTTPQILIILASALLSGMINVMLFFVLVPVFEKVFNIVSDFRYAELASTNQPLLKQLMEEAPGTFHHSMMVSNYVEACAAAIGEDTYFARCAGLYHDIGKLKNPMYFIENQQIGTKNPHDDLTPELSVMFIKKHIMNGIAISAENKLPVELKAVISEHHGTLPIISFFEKAKKYSEVTPDIRQYSYDGGCPTTKVAAIVMIADASEAALRALSAENRASADAIVDKIIMDRLTSRQFDDCDITLQELKIIRETIVTSFVGVKHGRIVYPGQEKK